MADSPARRRAEASMEFTSPPLAPYVEGSLDSRTFLVDGRPLSVSRGPTSREAGFEGTGRDGDVVLPGDPTAAAFARVTQGIPGLSPLGSTGCAADSEATLVQLERALLAASGGYATIIRAGHRVDQAVARQLFRTPRLEGRRRTVSLTRGLDVMVELKPSPAAGAPETVTVTAWAYGKPPGDLVETTLTRLGTSAERIGGGPVSPQFALPLALVLPFLDAVLAALCPDDVRITDG